MRKVTLVDPIRPSHDSRLDALVARATQVAVQRHSGGSEEPHRRPLLIGLAVLGVAAIGAGFVVAALVSNDGPADSASTTDSAVSAVTLPPVTAAGAATADSSTPQVDVSAPAPTSDTTLPQSVVSTTSIALTAVQSDAVTTSPPVAAAAQVLTGPPSMQLPGGQPWPNGLYQDNIMYLRGTVPSEEVGGDLQRRAEDILGAENVRNELVIDPSVPKVETVIVRLGNSVLFKSGDFDIPPESEPGFQLWAAFLASNPSVTLTVIGHADSRGTPESNQQLALQRAQVAAERITRNGIDVSRVTSVSRGADDPVAANDTREGRALNRRVEFAVTGLLKA